MVQISGNSQMLIGGEFPRSSQFKKFLNVVLHRNAVGKSHWWKIGSFAPPGGGNALRKCLVFRIGGGGGVTTCHFWRANLTSYYERE